MNIEALTRTQPKLAYRVYGESGPPVLFIMGFGMPGGVWAPQVKDLGRDHRCCQYDHLGLGDSERGGAFPSIRSMAEDAIRILDDLGWRQAHIVGVSMGGMIAQELVLNHQPRCATLTLVATHFGGFRALTPTPQGTKLFAQGVVGGHKARVRSLPRLLYPDAYLEQVDRKKFDAHMKERLGRPADPATMFGQLLAVWRHRTGQRLGKIEVPTLLVRAGQDILIRPVQTDRLSERVEHATVLGFPDAGHGITFQKAAELNAALRDHFTQAPQ